MKNRYRFYMLCSFLLYSSCSLYAGMDSAVIRMSVNVIQATCDAVSVNDVDFGTVLADKVGSSEIYDLQGQLSINCYGSNSVSLKVKFSPVNGVMDANGGVIASSNPSVAYVLYWATPEVAPIGSPVKLEQELSFLAPEPQGTNITSFYVRPIKRMATVSGSHADTQVVIHVIYE